MEQKIWKVYKHTSPNNKIYIGITSQKNVNSRWKRGKGYIHNIHFTNAINKYGWNNFKHEIIAKNLTEKEAKKLEVELIAKFNSMNPKYGYNMTAGGDGTVGLHLYGEKNPFYGKHHTEETKQKMSENHYDYYGENNPFYGKHHSEESKRKMSEAAKGKYAGENNPNYGKKLSQERKEQIRQQKSVSVCQFDKDMNFIKQFSSTKEAEEETGINHSLICRVCRGKLKSIHGYIWKYTKDLENEVA